MTVGARPWRTWSPGPDAGHLQPRRGPARRAARDERGQATVELLAWLPLAVAVVLAVGCLLAAGAARELAGHAAQAGAVAVLQGDDPARAARQALPGWSRARVAVRVRGRVVRARVAPPLPVKGLADALTATATADAGPVAR